MAVYLKAVAVLVVMLGVLSGSQFLRRVVDDEELQRAVLMTQRNAGNVLFESEYRIAQARHMFFAYSAMGCFLIALIGGSVLWGVGTLHSKLDARRPEAKKR